MATKEEFEEQLESRTKADLKHFQGELPERYAIVWNGYLAGLYEWELIERYNAGIERRQANSHSMGRTKHHEKLAIRASARITCSTS